MVIASLGMTKSVRLSISSGNFLGKYLRISIFQRPQPDIWKAGQLARPALTAPRDALFPSAAFTDGDCFGVTLI